MQKITFTNARGDTITFSDVKPFILRTIEGTGGLDTEIRSTRSPYQDGSTFISAYVADRDITITGYIITNDIREMYALRRQLSSLMNPKLGLGKLIYTNDDRTYAIQAVAESSPVFSDRYVTNQAFTLSFTCPNPYWMDEQQTTRALKYEENGLTFPLRLPTSFAFSSYKGIFTNDGDVDTPVIIHYQGPAKNPAVINETTNKKIKVNYDLTADDVLEISTEFGNKRVEVVKGDGTRVNVFHWIDLESDFFQLVPGDNLLTYESDQEKDRETAIVTVYWNNRYSGG